MISHEAVWTAIDTLALNNGLSSSGLARAAGLDLTCLNPSKRFTDKGAKRWPTFATVDKILDATNTTLPEFVDLVLQHTDSQKRRRNK